MAPAHNLKSLRNIWASRAIPKLQDLEGLAIAISNPAVGRLRPILALIVFSKPIGHTYLKNLVANFISTCPCFNFWLTILTNLTRRLHYSRALQYCLLAFQKLSSSSWRYTNLPF